MTVELLTKPRRGRIKVLEVLDCEPVLPEVQRHHANPLYDGPAWRYELAGTLMKEDRVNKDGSAVEPRLSRNLDPIIAQNVIPFLREEGKTKTQEDQDRLAEKYPGLFWAYRTFHDVFPVLRYRLEAVFVGGATVAEAAAAFNLEENYVWWFAKMFFDVHGRLKNLHWVKDRVIFEALRKGVHDAKYNLLWKLIAGLAGWKYFVNGNDGVIQPLTYEAATRITEVVRFKAVEDACITQLTRTITKFNQAAILEEHSRFEELELKKRAASDEGVEDDKSKAFVAVVGSIVGALTMRRAEDEEVPRLEGPLATLYESRDRSNAERAKVAEAIDTTPNLRDD